MKNFLIGLFIFVTALVVALSCDKGSSGDGYLPNLPVKIPTRIDYSYRTANGINVASVVAIPEDKQNAVFESIETGITMQITATNNHKPEWQTARRLSDYRIIFINPDATNRDGSPALLFDGIYQTAGTALGFGLGKAGRLSPPAIVLPHQSAQNWSYLIYLRDASRFESEHFAEGSNDIGIYNQFATANDVHPHWKLDGEQ